MDNAIVISPLVAMILGLSVGLIVTVFGWFAKGYLKRMDRDRTGVLELIKQSDARSEGCYREVQAALCDLNTRVGRLEGAWSVKDSPTSGSEQYSPRRNDGSSPLPDGEVDPAQVSERFDPSMIPLAGVGAEQQHWAGLARQLVPGHHKADGTGSEPNAKESPDAARWEPGRHAGLAGRSVAGTGHRVVSASQANPDRGPRAGPFREAIVWAQPQTAGRLGLPVAILKLGVARSSPQGQRVPPVHNDRLRFPARCGIMCFRA